MIDRTVDDVLLEQLRRDGIIGPFVVSDLATGVDVGAVRTENEDRAYAGAQGVFAVADGLGGRPGGGARRRHGDRRRRSRRSGHDRTRRLRVARRHPGRDRGRRQAGRQRRARHDAGRARRPPQSRRDRQRGGLARVPVPGWRSRTADRGPRRGQRAAGVGRQRRTSLRNGTAARRARPPTSARAHRRRCAPTWPRTR